MYTFVTVLGKQVSPLKRVSGLAQRFRPLMVSLISMMTEPTSQK